MQSNVNTVFTNTSKFVVTLLKVMLHAQIDNMYQIALTENERGTGKKKKLLRH